jgi:hypothetical protein
MGWIGRHWALLLGLLAYIAPLSRGIKWLVGRGGDLDFIISRVADPGWVGVVINWILNPPAWTTFPLLLVGAVLIWWDLHRRKAVPAVDRQQPSEADASVAASPIPTNSVGGRRPDDHDLVHRNLRILATWNKDGADLTPLVRIRNRSLIKLQTKLEQQWSFQVDGRTPPHGTINIPGEIGPATDQAFGLPVVRIVKAAPGVTGHVELAVRFGPSPDSMLDILYMRYDFTIRSDLQKSSARQDLDCEIRSKIEYSKVTKP